MVTSEGIVPYQTVCRLVGRAPNRILQYNVVRTAVRTFLHNFDIKALNIGLTEIPLFHDEKVYIARNFRRKEEKKLKLKQLNQGQSDSGKRNVILKLKKTHTWLLS